jgi:hypothetical protein
VPLDVGSTAHLGDLRLHRPAKDSFKVEPICRELQIAASTSGPVALRARSAAAAPISCTTQSSATNLGVIAEAPVPWAAIAIATACAVVVAFAVAMCPGFLLSRPRVVRVLRTE